MHFNGGLGLEIDADTLAGSDSNSTRNDTVALADSDLNSTRNNADILTDSDLDSML